MVIWNVIYSGDTKMWRCCVLVVLVGQFGTILSAVVEQPENVRVARQVGLNECCPCDHSEHGSWNDQNKAADGSADVRTGVVDDCPCRDRAADADGASSILFPNAVQALRPLLKSNEAKKDLKPLLRPEVDLASSVLSTIKEVTEEDYQEALARDAARNAAKMLERDVQPEESAKNIVTIVLDPNSDSDMGDFVAQETRNQESQCIYPFDVARSSFKPLKKTPTLLDTLWSPSNMKKVRSKSSLLDMDNNVDAININEKTANAISHLPTFKSNSILSNVLGKMQQPKDINQLKMNTGDDCLGSTISRPRSSSDISNLDNALSPSNTEERIAKNPKSDFGEIISRPIKTLLKLRDVELIPKNVFGEKRLANPQDIIPPLDFDGLKHKLSQLKLPNLIEKIKQREPSQRVKPKLFDVDDNGLAASDVQEHVIKLPTLEPFTKRNSDKLLSKFGSIPAKEHKSATSIPEFTHNIAKLNNPFHETLSSIPNLLEGLKNNQKVSEARSIIDQQHGLKKSDISTKLKELRQKSRNLLLAKNILPNLISKTQAKDMVKIDSSSISKYKSAKKCESSFVKDVQETPTINEDLVQTKIVDADPSPSEDSATLMNPELGARDDENTSSDNIIHSEFEQEKRSDDNVSDDFQIENKNDFEQNKDFYTGEKSSLPFIKLPENNNKILQADDFILDNDSSETKESRDSTIPENENQDIAEILSSKVLPKSNIEPENESSRKEINILNKPNIRFVSQEVIDGLEDEAGKIPDAINNESQETVEKISEDLDISEESKKQSSYDNEKDSNLREDLSSSSTNPQQVTMQDLQKMSDALLDQDKQQKMSESIIEQDEQENNGHQSTNPELNSQTERAIPEKTEIQPNRGDIFTSKLEQRDSEENIPASTMVAVKPITLENNKKDADEINNNKEACASDLALEKLTPDVKDATPEASEMISNTLRSPLRLNRIVQPDSINGLNNLFNSPQPDLGDILNLHTKLPSLREIHTKVTKVLDPFSQLSGGDSSDVFERDSDLTQDPSERSFKSALPSRYSPEPLEIDVFQLNPLSSSRFSPSSANLPRLNLDTLRTKLAMPKSLGIKPLRLESAVGDKRGMIGASLLFGSDKKDLMKAESTSLLDKIRNSNSLKSSIGDLPTIEDLGSRMREHFSNLFNIDTSPLNLGSSSIGSLDSLRSRAEDRVKNLHNTLKSSMRKAKETSSNILSNAYAQPNNLFEEISQRHEDLTDKLKGIHYDLNDRLTSLHDSLLEKTNLPRLDFFQPKDEYDDHKLKPKFNFQRTEPTLTGRKKVKKLRSNDDLYATSKANPERTKKIRMVPTSSVQVPKIMETPKLMKAQNDLMIQPLPREAKPESKQQNKGLGIIPPHTQMRSEMFQPESDMKTKTKHFRPQFNFKPIPNKLLRSALPNALLKKDSKSLRDAKSAPSENYAIRLPTSATNSALQRSNLKSLIPERVTQRKAVLTTAPKTPNPIKQLKTADDLRKAFTLPKLSWPKATENSFLSKVREALRTRLDSPKAVDTSRSIGKSINAKDMDRSASTIVKNIDSMGQLIREKASYKCKMVCTRDSSELN